MMDQAAIEHANVVNLASRRPPAVYAVDVTSWWDGRMSVHVRDVDSGDLNSRRAIAWALREAADAIERGAYASAS